MTGPSAYAVDRFRPAARSGEATQPADWDWTGFAEPRYRFDPRSGAFRTRYAEATLVGAVRERYRSTGLVIPADHLTHHLVRLVSARNLRVLDLRTEKNLDVLQVDDQISTGQHLDVWATCHRLVDAARRWWTDIDVIVYRSRTAPESSLNWAFFGDDAFDVESWHLDERIDTLTTLVLHHGFTVNWDIDIDKRRPRYGTPRNTSRTDRRGIAGRTTIRPPHRCLVGIGWLAEPNIERWERGRVLSLDRCVQVDSDKVIAALAALQHWCRDAAKIDRNRRDTLTKPRRVAEACQSRLHRAVNDGVSFQTTPTRATSGVD